AVRPGAATGRPDPAGAAGAGRWGQRRAGTRRAEHRVRPAARGAGGRAAHAGAGERPAPAGGAAPAELADLPGRGERAPGAVARRGADYGADPPTGGTPAGAVVGGAH